MASSSVVILLLFSILRLPPMLGPRMDEATQEAMQKRAEFLQKEMAQQLQELQQLEEASLKQQSMEKMATQSSFPWESFSFYMILRQWHFWALPGSMVVLIKLCSRLWKSIHRESSKGEEDSSGSGENISMKEEEEEEKEKEEKWVVEKLVGHLLCVLRECLSSDGYFPVPQPAIGIGSTFEGWGPREHNSNYCLLVPLKPPRGHTFKVQLGSAQEVPAQHRVHVHLVCTCRKNTTPAQNTTRCLFHRPTRESSLLSQLCTGLYLNAEKTAQWFQSLVSSTWGKMSLARRYALRVLPSTRSCKIELTDTRGRCLSVELLFGVQLDNSDIFLISQAPETILTSSTTWAESYAVAEAKFFHHLARQAPQDTFHLKCLEIYASTLAGTVLSSFFLKTAILHLLNFIPLSGWQRESYLTRLQDILCYLRSCLKNKCLDHFFYGNELLPDNIILPVDIKEAEPFNIFECLVQGPAAYEKALEEFCELEERLMGILHERA